MISGRSKEGMLRWMIGQSEGAWPFAYWVPVSMSSANSSYSSDHGSLNRARRILSSGARASRVR